MRLAIVNMSHRKCVRTLERFFAPNQSQSESQKNETEEEQCINQEETDEDRRKLKKSRDHMWLRYEKEAMFCYFCRKSKDTNPFASAEGCTNFCPSKNKNVPQNFSQGDKLSRSGQILAQTPAYFRLSYKVTKRMISIENEQRHGSEFLQNFIKREESLWPQHI